MAGEGYKFIELALNKQKQQAAIDYESRKDQQRDIAMALSQVADFSAVADRRAGQKKRDDIANSLMNKSAPPRAEAADPRLAAEMVKAGLGPTKPATGGVEEMQMRMDLMRSSRQDDAQRFDQEMADWRRNRLEANLNRENPPRANAVFPGTNIVDLSADQRATAAIAEQQRDEQAIKAATSATKQMREAVSDSDAYHSGIAAMMPKIQGARTRQEYDAQVTALQKLQTGAVTRGLKVDQPALPPFRGDVILDAQRAAKKNPGSTQLIAARLRQMGIDPREAGIEGSGQSIPWDQ